MTTDTGSRPTVLFRLLGPFSVHLRGQALRRTLTGPAQHLLIYLLLHAGQRHRREWLMEQIWPDGAAPSRAAFNTALWRVRRFLEGLPDTVLDVESDTLRLQLGPMAKVDVAALDHAARSGDIPALEVATLWWRGPLADGLTQDWSLVAREKAHNAYVQALGQLMRHAGTAGDLDTALDYGLRILDEDPFRESVHAEVLWLYVLGGQRARAIRLHHAFCALLEAELGIKPMAETSALFDFIVQGLEEPPQQKITEKIKAGDPAPVQSYLGYLDAVAKSRATIFQALRSMHPSL